MTRHAAGRRTLVEWLKDDFAQAIGPRRLVRLLRREPRLLVRWLIELAIGLIVIAVALLAVRHLDYFPEGGIFAGGFAGASFSERARQALKKFPDLQSQRSLSE